MGNASTISKDTVFANGQKLGTLGSTVTYSNCTLDFTGIKELYLAGNVILDNATVKANGLTLYAEGYAFTVNKNVNFDGTIDAIYGGENNGVTGSTNLKLLAGNYTEIYGGSNGGMVLGDTHVVVGGEVNPQINVADHNIKNRVYGGGQNALVTGNTYVTIQDNAQTSVVYGGGKGSESEVGGACYVNAIGGNVMGYYGGSYQGIVHNTVVTMTSGTTEQIYGGCQLTSMTGNTNVTVTGGTITRRIYGGCYNDATASGTSLTWKDTKYHVIGTTNVTLGEGATYPIKESITEDNGICASSRWKDKLEDEVAVIRFVTQAAYNKCSDQLRIFGVGTFENMFLDLPLGYDNLYIAGEEQ